MQIIYKYTLSTESVQVLSLPKDSLILNVLFQGYVLMLWALIDTEKDTEERIFEIVYTGQPLVCQNLERKHITTLQNGLVYHIFELFPKLEL